MGFADSPDSGVFGRSNYPGDFSLCFRGSPDSPGSPDSCRWCWLHVCAEVRAYAYGYWKHYPDYPDYPGSVDFAGLFDPDSWGLNFHHYPDYPGTVDGPRRFDRRSPRSFQVHIPIASRSALDAI